MREEDGRRTGVKERCERSKRDIGMREPCHAGLEREAHGARYVHGTYLVRVRYTVYNIANPMFDLSMYF
eukprot:2946135-Pleurochrysis_carterae.AAC.5